MPCCMPKTVNFNVLTWLDMSNKKTAGHNNLLFLLGKCHFMMIHN